MVSIKQTNGKAVSVFVPRQACYLEPVEDISSIKTIVTESVQEFHLCAEWQLFKLVLLQGIGLPFFQFPAVIDNVYQVTAKGLNPKKTKQTDAFGLQCIFFI